MSSESQLLLTKGQLIARFPKAQIHEVARLFVELYPDHKFALLVDGEAKLIVYPPLDEAQQARWREECAKLHLLDEK